MYSSSQVKHACSPGDKASAFYVPSWSVLPGPSQEPSSASPPGVAAVLPSSPLSSAGDALSPSPVNKQDQVSLYPSTDLAHAVLGISSEGLDSS